MRREESKGKKKVWGKREERDVRIERVEGCGSEGKVWGGKRKGGVFCVNDWVAEMSRCSVGCGEVNKVKLLAGQRVSSDIADLDRISCADDS